MKGLFTKALAQHKEPMKDEAAPREWQQQWSGKYHNYYSPERQTKSGYQKVTKTTDIGWIYMKEAVTHGKGTEALGHYASLSRK